MKALFLVFHTLKESCGISKKIRYQAEALRNCGVDTKLCYYKITDNKHYCRMVNEHKLVDYGTGIKGLFKKRFFTGAIPAYVRNEGIHLVYIRCDHNANPCTIWLVKQLKKHADKVIMEIPTYPYNNKYDTIFQRICLLIDRCFRKTLAKHLDYIVSFSEDEEIFGRPTIRISNAVDFRVLPLKTQQNDTSSELHLLSVATMAPWHGIDRIINGLAQYYARPQNYRVYLHLVGGFRTKADEQNIVSLIKEYQLQSYVILHGVQNGENLDSLFEMADMAIGSLGVHRIGLEQMQPLKSREYAARGMAFAYSHSDSDFDQENYVIRFPQEESPISIRSLIEFYQNIKTTPQEIRNSVSHLSWENQMEKVLAKVEEN